MMPVPSSQGFAEFKVMLEIGDVGNLQNVMVYDTGVYGTNIYGADGDAYLTDITEYVQRIPSIANGRQKYTSRFKTGTTSIDLDNTNGEWTPNAGAPLPGFLPLRPGRKVQVFIAVDGGEFIQIYDGFIDTLTDTYGRDGNLITRIRALDFLSSMALNNLPAVISEGDGEGSDVRAQRILNRFFSTPPTLIAPILTGAFTTMQDTTLGQSALSEMQITADSEGGGVFMSPKGEVVFTHMDWFTDNAALPPLWVVDGLTVKAWTIGTADWSASRIVNEAHFSEVGGTEQVVANAGSIAKYERRTHTRLDLQTDDPTHVTALAQRIVTNLANDRAQIIGLTLQPSTVDEALMGTQARIGDIVRLTVSTTQGWSYVVITQIFGVRHVVTPNVWQVEYLLDDTEVVQRGPFSPGFSDGFDV